MVNYKAKRRKKRITTDDIRILREKLKVGDSVWIEVEAKGELCEDVRNVRHLIRAKVVRKYPHLVEISGNGISRRTATYKEILMGKEKKRKEHEKAVG